LLDEAIIEHFWLDGYQFW